MRKWEFINSFRVPQWVCGRTYWSNFRTHILKDPVIPPFGSKLKHVSQSVFCRMFVLADIWEKKVAWLNKPKKWIKLRQFIMHLNIWKALRSIVVKKLQKSFDHQILFLFKYLLTFQEARENAPLCLNKHMPTWSFQLPWVSCDPALGNHAP